MKRAKYIVYYMVWSIFSLLVFGSCDNQVYKDPLNDWSVTFGTNEAGSIDDVHPYDYPFDVGGLQEHLDGYYNYYDDEETLHEYCRFLWTSENGHLSKSVDTIPTALLWVGTQPYRADYFDKVIHARSESLLPTIVVKDSFWHADDCRPFDIEAFAKEVNENRGCRDSELKLLSSGKVCHLPTEMCKSRIHHDSTVPLLRHYTSHKVIATIDDEPIAIRYSAPDEAPLILVSTPLLFTNYGCSYDGENFRFILQLMDEVFVSDEIISVEKMRAEKMKVEKGKVVTTDDEEVVDEETEVVVVADEALTYAWTLYFEKRSPKQLLYVSQYFPSPSGFLPGLGLSSTLIDLLIAAVFIGFLLFYARRRQRIVPVIQEPKNRTVELAEQIGKNYYWRNETREVLRKKFVILLDWVKERTNISFEDNESLERNVAHLAKLLGENPQPLLLFFRRMFFLQQNAIIVSVKEMRDRIDKMNSIIKKLK